MKETKTETKRIPLFHQIPIDGYTLFGIILLYCLNSFWLKNQMSGWTGYFLRCHFNDLCAGIFIMAYINLLLGVRNKKLQELYCILPVCLAAGIVWVFFAPLINSRSTTDSIDLICYVSGGCLYWLIMRIANEK